MIKKIFHYLLAFQLYSSTIYTGEFLWGFSLEGLPDQSALDTLQSETKIHADIISFFIQWPENSEQETLPLIPSLQAIRANGGVPCITWEPMYIKNKEKYAINYERIISGSYNGYLLKIAQEVKSFGNPVLLRFAHEMNLKSYHWGTSERDYGENSPRIYKELFRYLVNFFKQHKVNNVLWIFCPNSESVPDTSWNQAINYYPGDDYVDILGMDGYNWNLSAQLARRLNKDWHSPYRSFREIFEPLYTQLRGKIPSKPIIVCETASVSRGKIRKSLWVKDAIDTALKWNLLGIIWFHINKEEDWRINQYGDYDYIPFIHTATSTAQRLFIKMNSHKSKQ